MKNVKTTILIVILMILTTLVIGVAAESVLMKNQEKNKSDIIFDKPSFLAEITFTIVINDGCGCNPIEGVTISAYGGAGNDENITDVDGTCVLELEINSIYTASITEEDYVPILFEFIVIDDQYFVYQMTLKDESTASMTPAIQKIMDILNR